MFPSDRREFSALVECIRAPVEVTCGPEAARLVPHLVRPSVQFSEHCNNETLLTTTAPPPASVCGAT